MIRYRIEFWLAALFAVATVVTAMVPDWIEAVFGVDPDGGNGSLEFAIVVGLAVLAMVAAGLAVRDHRRARPA